MTHAPRVYGVSFFSLTGLMSKHRPRNSKAISRLVFLGGRRRYRKNAVEVAGTHSPLHSHHSHTLSEEFRLCESNSVLSNGSRAAAPHPISVALHPQSLTRTEVSQLHFDPWAIGILPLHRPTRRNFSVNSRIITQTRDFCSTAAVMVATKLDGTAIAKGIRERLGAEILEKQKINPRYKPSLKIIQGLSRIN